MSIIDDKTPIILYQIDKIGSGFQKMFKTKLGSMKSIKLISQKPVFQKGDCVNMRKYVLMYYLTSVSCMVQHINIFKQS